MNNNLRLQLDNNPRINGLTKFITNLEREYFSKVTVRNCTPDISQNNLVIELECPLNLVELVDQLKQGHWALNVRDPLSGREISPLENALLELSLINETKIEVEEFSIFLKDSSLIIKKIYQQSIPEQLVNIFDALSEHLNPLTKKQTDIPFEIYVPVFEEDLTENDAKIANIEQSKNERKDYFSYWGLYFESDEDAVIYELPKKRIIGGELHMLNH